MVLLESAITELSSLTASVTLKHKVSDRATPRFSRAETYIKEFGFFFFLRMAVATSSFPWNVVSFMALQLRCGVKWIYFFLLSTRGITVWELVIAGSCRFLRV